jgi:RNA recognition motif-containing protein
MSAAVLRQRRNGNTKSSMGCGVVEYSTREIALEAVEIMNETELKGRMIRCREDRVPGEDELPTEDSSEQKGTSDAPVGVIIFLYLCLIGCSPRFTCRG